MSSFFESIKKIFIDDEYNKRMESMEKEKPFLDKLREKGFHFNPDELWWERIWLVATKTGSETSKEVYVKKEEEWKVVMYGNDGDVFFEHKVNGTN